MIPGFDEHGYLPQGIHRATLGEIEARFGIESELRRVQMQSLYWLVDLARRAGIERIILNGSFVTDTDEPNDVDCVLLIGARFPADPDAAAELVAGLPFLQVDLVRQLDFDVMVEKIFATDRAWIPKGMVEVTQWT
jgi:hypothetical protein